MLSFLSSNSVSEDILERAAFILQLYPDKIEAYRETHRAVWQEMIDVNRAAGIRPAFRIGGRAEFIRQVAQRGSIDRQHQDTGAS